MKKEWTIKVGDKIYTPATIEQSVARGTAYENFITRFDFARWMNEVQPIIKNYCQEMESPNSQKDNTHLTIDDVMSCFKELGLSDLTRNYGFPEIEYYPDSDSDRYLHFWWSDTPFLDFVGDGNRDYPFSPDWLTTGISFLDKESFKTLITELNPIFKRWCEEDSLIKRVFDKGMKQASIVKRSIRTLIEDELQGLDYDGELYEGKTHMILTINLSRNRKLEIPMTYKSHEKITKGLRENVEKNIAVTNEIPFSFKINKQNEPVKE